MKTFLAALAVFAVGCGVSSGEAVVVEGDETTVDDSFELSTTKDTFLVARRDQRRCVSPMCGGYWVKDVNSTMQERYVSGFDFSAAQLSDEVQGQVAGAADFELVLVGNEAVLPFCQLLFKAGRQEEATFRVNCCFIFSEETDHVNKFN